MEITKTTKVLNFRSRVDGQVQYGRPEDRFEVNMPSDLWNLMDEPDQITVTVERGDRMNTEPVRVNIDPERH